MRCESKLKKSREVIQRTDTNVNKQYKFLYGTNSPGPREMQGIRYKQLALPKKESPSQVYITGLSRELKEQVYTTNKCYICNLELAWIIDPSAYRPK